MASFAASALATPVQRQALDGEGRSARSRGFPVPPSTQRGRHVLRRASTSAAGSDRSMRAPQPRPTPHAWNNRATRTPASALGEGTLGLRAGTKIAKDFVFARANYALALYETGRTGEAVGIFRGLTAKYQGFADMSAALAAGLAASGQLDEADRQWEAALSTDPRYADLDWLRTLPRPVLPFQPPQALQLPLSFPLARSA
eukprot:tig00020611_g12100.t1